MRLSRIHHNERLWVRVLVLIAAWSVAACAHTVRLAPANWPELPRLREEASIVVSVDNALTKSKCRTTIYRRADDCMFAMGLEEGPFDGGMKILSGRHEPVGCGALGDACGIPVGCRCLSVEVRAYPFDLRDGGNL